MKTKQITNKKQKMKTKYSIILIFLTVICNAQIVNIPNANFKAKLIELGKDTNADGQIQLAEALAVTSLGLSDASISDITGIEAFTNLQSLYCNNNQLTALNLQGLTNLQTLLCSNNQITTLNVQGLTNLQYLYCDYNQLPSLNLQGLTNLYDLRCIYNQLTTLNVQGLTNLQYLYCYNNQLSTLNLQGLTNLYDLRCDSNQLTSLNVQGLPILQTLLCSENQLTTLNVQGLTNLQMLYCHNNLLTNLNAQGLTNLQTLSCDSNQLTTINVQGLTNLQTLLCENNQLTTLNVQGLSSLQQLHCYNNQLTTMDAQGLTNLQSLYCHNNQLISLFIKNGSNESIIFIGNPNLTYICADDNEIASMQNLAIGYGYNNCNVNSYCSFTPGGIFYTINGTNKIDVDNNGCNASDISFPNLKFTMTDGTNTGGLIADATGNYTTSVQSGTHTITPILENPTYFTISPVTSTVSFPATASPFNQYFCITPNGVHHDLEVVIIPMNVARPGFDAIYKIKYKNKGNFNENATISFNYNDAILDYVSSSVAAITQSSGMLSWNIGLIAPFQSGEIMITLNVNSPTEMPAVNAGDFLSFISTINGLNTDETPDDTTFTLAQEVVNSFDPNDKTCLEGSTINPIMIGKYVHYKVKFENTGTFPAQNIVVKDIIDTTKFDISTLQITDNSHSCISRITNPDKVEFIFENINLPFDDANNDGYIVFKIKTKSTLVLGNSFSNLANIYFDYNFPIETNNYTTTIQNSLGTNPFEIDNLTIFPNPVKDILQFNTIEKVLKIEVYDITGRILSSNSVDENKVDLSELKTGNYTIKVYTENGITNTKIIKE